MESRLSWVQAIFSTGMMYCFYMAYDVFTLQNFPVEYTGYTSHPYIPLHIEQLWYNWVYNNKI